MLTWQWRSFYELTLDELYEILALREQVFTIEQSCRACDVDFHDQHALHLLGKENNQLTAYSRLFIKSIDYPGAITIGRVLVHANARSKGFGKKMMDEILIYLKKHDHNAPIIISAQQYLEKFYIDYGFKTISKPYDDGGIPHIEMRKDHV